MAEQVTRVILRIAYDGSEFHGFTESDGVRTVAGELRRIVEQVTRTDRVILRGASRTDTGVHALDQCVRIDAEGTLAPEKLARAIACLAPEDIEVRSFSPGSPHFNPSSDAIEKRYVYRLWNSHRASVLGRHRLWAIGQTLDLDAMVRAAKSLVGTHDFEAFRNRSNGGPENTIRTIRAIELRHSLPEVWIQVIGDGFLYRMVRNIVGMLVEVGRGSAGVASVGEVLQSRDRTLAGQTAPPHGLHLAQIRYPGEPECVVDEVPLRF